MKWSARAARVLLEGIAVGREQEELAAVDFGFDDAGVGDERSGVMHGQLNRRPGASAVGGEGGDELRFLAVLVDDGAAHREAPDDVLPGRAVEHGIGVGELDGALALAMVEDRDGFLPGIAVVPRDGG